MVADLVKSRPGHHTSKPPLPLRTDHSSQCLCIPHPQRCIALASHCRLMWLTGSCRTTNIFWILCSHGSPCHGCLNLSPPDSLTSHVRSWIPCLQKSVFGTRLKTNSPCFTFSQVTVMDASTFLTQIASQTPEAEEAPLPHSSEEQSTLSNSSNLHSSRQQAAPGCGAACGEGNSAANAQQQEEPVGTAGRAGEPLSLLAS